MKIDVVLEKTHIIRTIDEPNLGNPIFRVINHTEQTVYVDVDRELEVSEKLSKTASGEEARLKASVQ
jgi:hypothetical protein